MWCQTWWHTKCKCYLYGWKWAMDSIKRSLYTWDSFLWQRYVWYNFCALFTKLWAVIGCDRGTGGQGPQDKYEDCGSVQVNLSVLSDSLWPHGLPHARLPRPSPTSGPYLNSCPSSRSCHPTIASSAVPFSGLQFSPTWGSFQMSQFFTTGGQSIGTSASASVLPMNIQDWFPLAWTSWISL